MMNLNLLTLILSYLTLALLIASKFADCFTTQRFVRHESNRFGRWLMQKIGRVPAIWTVFLLAFGIIMASWAPTAMQGSSQLYRTGFIFGGLLISLFQLSVAHANYTGAQNPITRIISRWRIHR